MRGSAFLIVAVLLAPGAVASGREEPREDERSPREAATRLALDLAASHWFARAYRANALTGQIQSLNDPSFDSSPGETWGFREGSARAQGAAAATRTYKAFLGLRRSDAERLGLEAGGRALGVSTQGISRRSFEFDGYRFLAGQLVTMKLDYSSVDLDLAYDRTFDGGAVRLELRAGFSYLASRVRLRGTADQATATITVEGPCPMAALGLVWRPVDNELFTVELFARARGGGWPFDTLGLAQTEAGISFVFWRRGGVSIGHRLESAYLDRDPPPKRPANQLTRRERVLDKRIELAAEGPFVALFLRF